LAQMGVLALLVVGGLWLLRGRAKSSTIGGSPAEPAQAPPEPLSPTGESYTEESDDRE
jgi:hypothetical protein